MKTEVGVSNWRLHAAHAKERVAVVGAGIVGLAHAWAAARRGHEVLLFDRHPAACGASIRNFGMVWPIGQPNGPLYRTALRSRELWLELLRETGLWYRDCGSLHLAYKNDEFAVLAEFAEHAPDLGYECQLLSAQQVSAISPAARCAGLLGGLWSATEMCVDPREVITKIPLWLKERCGVQLHFRTAIDFVGLPWVVASDGRRWQVDRVIVATGADFYTLYPRIFERAGFRLCKLQMLRTPSQPEGWRLGPMLAGGLTLRHYASFRVCRTLPALKERIAVESPDLDRYGVHVMAAQNGRDEIVLGDSHEYDEEVSPFDKSCVESLILAELRQLIELPDWTIQERWHGVYAQIPDVVQFVREPSPGVTLAIASGGCGMTMSFGLADEMWHSWESSDRMAAECPSESHATPHVRASSP